MYKLVSGLCCKKSIFWTSPKLEGLLCFVLCCVVFLVSLSLATGPACEAGSTVCCIPELWSQTAPGLVFSSTVA